MKLVVTGGEGFIGSHLIQNLKLKGYNVISIDNRDIESYYTSNGEIQKEKKDIREYQSIKEIIKSADGIIHLAAVSRVIWGESFPKICFDTNITSTFNILEAAKKSGKNPWFIFGSSREVYGETNSQPICEKHPLNPINTYGISKLAAEQLTKQYAFQNRRKALTLRFSNVYGGLNDIFDRVTPTFIIKSLLNEPVQINGGNQVFDFTHICDTVNGILAAIDYILDVDKKPFYDDFHILPGEANTLYNLVENIQEALNKELEVKYGPKRSYDVDRFVGDPKKAEEVLGFKCKIHFKEGIKKTVRIFSSELKKNREKLLKKYQEDKKCELL